MPARAIGYKRGMSILDRILGYTPTERPPIGVKAANPAAVPDTSAPQPVPGARPAPADQPVRVYDSFGRKVEIGRDAWRREVLLPKLAANRDRPDALASLIAGGLNEEFAADVLEAARHLAATDPKPQRGAAVLGATLLQLQDFPGARQVLEGAIARHGENAQLLAQLARSYEASGDHEKALELIWRALQLDPNEGTSLSWLVSAAQARGGREMVLAAYARAAGLAGSWRAQLWLARNALEAGNIAEAMRFYDDALSRAGRQVPAALLMQLSGDLGTHGHAAQLLALTQPRFDLAVHGLVVGNNLLRAYLDLGQLAEARKLLERLYALQRPDWREALQGWERQIDDAERRYGEMTGTIEVLMVRLEEPVWGRGVLGFEKLLPAKADDAPRIDFLCASAVAAGASDSGRVIAQPTNELGRIARSLPMFFAEELFLTTHARAHFVLPWMKGGGFILSARPWTREFLPADADPAEAYVFMHVDAQGTPWKLHVTIELPGKLRDGESFAQSFSLASGAADARKLLDKVRSSLSRVLELRRDGTADALEVPSSEILPGYLTALEQALAVGLAARAPGGDTFLHQERAIFDHLLDVAVQAGPALRPRLLLLTALENEARRRPQIVREFVDRLALLQQRHPVAAHAELVAQAAAAVAARAQRPPT